MQIHYNGYIGKNYNSNIPTKDIAKLCKEHIKKNWKGCKVSITTDYNEISLSLMAAPFTPFNMFEAPNFSEYDKKRVAKGYMQINNYHFDSDERLSPKTISFFEDINNFLGSYNFKDQDPHTDYYHCNFYINFSIGKYDKPFIKK